MENEKRGLYAVQFHPEVMHTVEGMKMLSNFVFGVCKSVLSETSLNNAVETSTSTSVFPYSLTGAEATDGDKEKRKYGKQVWIQIAIWDGMLDIKVTSPAALKVLGKVKDGTHAIMAIQACHLNTCTAICVVSSLAR